MNTYKVLELSYINGALQQPGAIVTINDDPDNGGMRPGKALVACDEDGNEVKRKPAARKAKASAEDLS